MVIVRCKIVIGFICYQSFVNDILRVVARFHFSSVTLVHHIIFQNFLWQNLFLDSEISFGSFVHGLACLLWNSVCYRDETVSFHLLHWRDLILEPNATLLNRRLISDRWQLNILPQMNIQLWVTDSLRCFGWCFLRRCKIGHIRLNVIDVITLGLSNWFELLDLVSHSSILLKAITNVHWPF